MQEYEKERVLIINTFSHVYDRLNDQEGSLNRAKKTIRKQSRSAKVNAAISAMAIVYMALSTQVIMHQSKRVDNLTKEIVSIKKKHLLL